MRLPFVTDEDTVNNDGSVTENITVTYGNTVVDKATVRAEGTETDSQRGLLLTEKRSFETGRIF